MEQPSVTNEAPESVSFAPASVLDEEELGILMELRGCVSLAMGLAGARASQMDLYQIIWYAMEAGRVRLYPTLSWTAESGASTELGRWVNVSLEDNNLV